MFSIFRLGLFYNEVLFDTVIEIHMKRKKWHLSGRELASYENGGILDEISKDTISER
jgi:hypothetical protein